MAVPLFSLALLVSAGENRASASELTLAFFSLCIEKSIHLRRILDMEVSDAKLRRLRRERAWSIRELAQRADVSTETIYSLDHGRREWAWPRTVRKLAR